MMAIFSTVRDASNPYQMDKEMGQNIRRKMKNNLAKSGIHVTIRNGTLISR